MNETKNSLMGEVKPFQAQNHLFTSLEINLFARIMTFSIESVPYRFKVQPGHLLYRSQNIS